MVAATHPDKARAVLQALADGMSRNEAARRYGISASTITNLRLGRRGDDEIRARAAEVRRARAAAARRAHAHGIALDHRRLCDGGTRVKDQIRAARADRKAAA